MLNHILSLSVCTLLSLQKHEELLLKFKSKELPLKGNEVLSVSELCQCQKTSLALSVCAAHLHIPQDSESCSTDKIVTLLVLNPKHSQ